jgi:general secretion pathway protein F
LDQLLALNDEIAALARAGVPLDKGLLHMGRDLPGKLGRIAQELGERLQQGEPLARVLEGDQRLPPAYRAVVAAGIRSGQLAAALEGISSLIRRAGDLRRMVAVSLVYPLIVLAIAYLLFVFTLVWCVPVMVAVYEDFLPQGQGLRVLEWLQRTGPFWLPWLPPLVLVVLLVWWFRSRSAWSIGSNRRSSRLARQGGGYPTVARLLYLGRVAGFADTLALMLEHDVPLHEAVMLAADASGDRGLRDSCRTFGERLQRGEAIDAADLAAAPPLLAWLLSGIRNKSQLIGCLRRTAASYWRHANWMTRWLSVYLPMWLTTAIGATAAVVYALSVIVPWSQMLYDLSQP